MTGYVPNAGYGQPQMAQPSPYSYGGYGRRQGAMAMGALPSLNGTPPQGFDVNSVRGPGSYVPMQGNGQTGAMGEQISQDQGMRYGQMSPYGMGMGYGAALGYPPYGYGGGFGYGGYGPGMGGYGRRFGGGRYGALPQPGQQPQMAQPSPPMPSPTPSVPTPSPVGTQNAGTPPAQDRLRTYWGPNGSSYEAPESQGGAGYIR